MPFVISVFKGLRLRFKSIFLYLHTHMCIYLQKDYELELNAEDDNDGAFLSTLLIKLAANLSIESAHSAYVVPSPLKVLQF